MQCASLPATFKNCITMPMAGTWAAEPTPTGTQGTLSLERRNSVHEGDYISTETT